MSRKLVFSAVSIFALMTLVVSAQQPAQPQNGSGQQAGRAPAELTKTSDVATGFNPPAFTYLNQGGNHPLWYSATADMIHKGGMSAEELKLAHESDILVKQLAKAEGENKDKIKTKLNEALGKQFDLRQKRHEAEIAALEAQIKKLKEMVQKRQENRRDIISKRFEQLVRETEGLGW